MGGDEERNQERAGVNRRGEGRKAEDGNKRREEKEQRRKGFCWICNIFFLKLSCGFRVFVMSTIISSMLFCIPETFYNFLKKEEEEERD